MAPGKLVGTSVENKMTIPTDQLGWPGSNGVLTVSAMFSDDRFAGKDRHNDSSTRIFECKARLSDKPGETRNVIGNFGKEDGSTHLLFGNPSAKIQLTARTTDIFLEINSAGEISLATAEITANHPLHAKYLFEDALSPWLDKMSFTHQVPVQLSQIVIRDVVNEVQHIFFVSPPRHSYIKEGEDQIEERMMPIYALYRECQNVSTPFYKVLSLFKIMEGLLNPLRSEVLRELRRMRRDQTVPKSVVPDHPDIAEWLKPHIGKPIGAFVNGFLTNEYRNAIAHFELRDKSVMNVGSAQARSKALDVAFLADLCARILIQTHEALLARLNESGNGPG